MPERSGSIARLVAAALAIEVVLLLAGGRTQDLNRQFWDALFRLRNQLESWRPAYDGTVVYVDIDDSGLDRLRKTQLERSQHARLIEILDGAGVAAQLHDVIFARPTTDEGDGPLVEAARAGRDVFFGFALAISGGVRPSPVCLDCSAPGLLAAHAWPVEAPDGIDGLLEAGRPLIPFDRLAVAATALGFLDVAPDPDGVIRRTPLVARSGDQVFPSAALLVAAAYLGVSPDRVVVEPGREIRLLGARRPAGGGPHDVAIPIDRHGQMIINYLGPWESLTHYGIADVLAAADNRFERELLAEELGGRIAVVAYTSTGAADVGPVPGDTTFVLAGVHAQVINAILAESFLHELGRLRRALLLDLPVLAALVLVVLRFGAFAIAAAAVALVLAVGASVAVAFLAGWLVPIYEPTLLIAATAAVAVLARSSEERRQREALRQTLDAHFAPLVVDRLLASGDGFRTTGQRKELTILFSDIVGYTAYSSDVDPEHAQRLLNEYFDAMAEVVFACGGTLDKFMGDGLLVFFGDPEPQADHATRAVRCAVAMQEKVARLREQWSQRGELAIQIRIGVSSGVVVVGNMGSARRLSYTVIGSVVNLAQRLESQAATGGILISKRTYELLDGDVDVEPVGPMTLRGVVEPVEVYRVGGLDHRVSVEEPREVRDAKKSADS